MNIVLVNSEYSYGNGGCGGIARYAYTMADAFSKEGHIVHLIQREGVIPENSQKEINVHYIKHKKPTHFLRAIDRWLNGNIYWEMGFSEALQSKIDEINKVTPVDIVDIPDYGGLAFSFRKKRNYKLVVTFHTPSVIVSNVNGDSLFDKRFFKFERKSILNADCYKSPSVALTKDVSELYKIDINNIPIVPYPIDMKFCSNIPRDYSRGKDILYVGRLEKRKGLDLITERITEILSLDDELNITLAGEYELGTGINYRVIIENKLKPEFRQRVWFPGALNRYTLFSLYKKSDIFIFTSIFDNFPNALLEAMSAGLPIVSSNCGGVSEIASDKESALFFDYEDGDKFVNNIKLLIQSAELRKKLGEGAKHKIETAYSFKPIVRRYIESIC